MLGRSSFGQDRLTQGQACHGWWSAELRDVLSSIIATVAVDSVSLGEVMARHLDVARSRSVTNHA